MRKREDRVTKPSEIQGERGTMKRGFNIIAAIFCLVLKKINKKGKGKKGQRKGSAGLIV